MTATLILAVMIFISLYVRLKNYLKKRSDDQFMRNMVHSPHRRTPSELARFEKIRSQRVGSKKFIWHSAGDARCCQECARNNGKKFKWDKPPITGLPGEGKCCPDGKCRCWAEAVIPPPKKS
ncbi:TPA: hypothetical protein RRG66_002073 [Klebsiella pneumoniae]|nr:hypothetical protein [Klebsiella pneumoniae]